MVNRILLAIDESPASDRAIDYLSEWLPGTNATVRVVHALPRQPELAAAAARRADRPSRAERWFEMSREQAQSILIRAVERMKEHGLDPGSIDDALVYLDPYGTPADGLIEAARENDCATVVVGRNALPWHRELVHHHMADELVRKAEGLTVWVVE